MDFSKTSQLWIDAMDYDSSNELLIKDMKHVLTFARVYHLSCALYEMDLKKFIRILDLLPEIESLRIQSIRFDSQMTLSAEEDRILASILTKSKITKVYLEKFQCLKDYVMLTVLCPSMIYLKIDQIDVKNLCSYLVSILQQISCTVNNQLRFISIRFPLIDDQFIELFQDIINDQHLSIQFVVERVFDHIDVQRK